MQDQDPDALLTVEDLADLLKVPQGTIYAWRNRRVGPPGLKVGKHLRFRRADVARWLDQQGEVA